jgi:hypothetical protein
LLPAARVIELEARIWLTPVLKHTDKNTLGEMLGNIGFSHESKPDP